MKNLYLLISALILVSVSLNSQMIVDGDSLVGNEWISFDQEYYKIKISEDGIYRLSFDELTAAGIDAGNIRGKDFQLFRLGDQVPVYTTKLGKFREGDFLEFYGQKNRGELDQFLYESEADMLNPGYSLVTDINTYFLTWKDGSTNRRYLEILNDLSGNLPAPLPYYLHSEEFIYSASHYKPTEQGQDYIKYSTLVTAEGFSSTIANNKTINLPAKNIHPNEDKASFRIRFGINKVFHEIELDFNGDRYEEYNTSNQYKVFNDTYSIPINKLKENNSLVIRGTNGNGDKVLVSQAELVYPRTFDFENNAYFHFNLDNTGFRRYIEARNFSGGDNAILLDLKNKTRRTVASDNGVYKIGVEPRNSDFEYILYNPSEEGIIKSVGTLQKTVFRDLSTMDHDYVIVSSEKLFEDPTKPGMNWVQEYANYRSSTAGGSFNSVIMTAEEIEDQFGYGIERHFIAVNNFANYVKNAWPSLEYFFVIGKGIEYPSYRTATQQEDILTANYYVPAWGAPGSDNLLFGQRGNNYSIAPVGRISAQNPSDVEIYLNKVKAHESNGDLPQTIEEKYWTKKMIHLSGGGNAGEQNLIASYLARMENTIEDEKFGADITTFKKTSADPLQNATSQAILDLIDGGVSLITFFGHSSVGTFDFSIEVPGEYKNGKRLPMILSLGCYSGNIFVPSKSKGLSEAFVLEPGVGSVAFAASSGSAYISSQGELGNMYYKSLTEDLYGASIGRALRNMFLALKDRTSIGYTTVLQQMTYHGDPAIKLIAHDGPDYLIDYKSVKTVPEIVSTADKEYKLVFDVVNLGSVISDSIYIAVEHILPNGRILDTIYHRIKPPESRKTISVTLLNEGTETVGKNTIRMEIDARNDVIEIPSAVAEANNKLDDGSGGDSFAYFVVDNAARPIYPSDFGIFTGTDPVILKASTSNLFTKVQNYVFQIDTSALFENPLDEAVVNSGGGLIEYQPNISLEKDVVYYWRIRAEEENPVLGRIWNGASFVYLPNSSEGWNQSHYFQYLEDESDGILVNEDRKFQFDTSGFNSKIINKLNNPLSPPSYTFNVDKPAGSVRPWAFMDGGTAILVGDKDTGSFWTNSGGEYGSIKTSNFGSFRVFGYDTKSEEQIKDLINLIKNIAPEGSYIYVITILSNSNSDIGLQNWTKVFPEHGESLKDILNNEGANFTNQLVENGNTHYTFIYQKGKKPLAEDIADDINDAITTDAFIPVLGTTGKFASNLIGPALSWDKLILKINNEESKTSSLSIIGVKENLDEIVLFSKLNENEIDLSIIDAQIYPYLKIQFEAEDKINRVPPNIVFWRILFSEFPELAFDQKLDFSFHSDTLNQGEELSFIGTVINSSNFSTDTLLVKYIITDSENNRIESFKRYGRIEKDDPLKISFSTETLDLSGQYQFEVELNPLRKQKEQFYFNNAGIRPFLVLGDETNPLLDVTFDNVRIMDNDIISSKPEIKIVLKDDNQFFLIDDPESFELKLNAGDINNLIPIPITSPDIEFIPATSENNEATINYTPDFEDGFYTLYVQGKDASGNFSGENEYAISFRVIGEESISQVYNYPNPFSTSTQFVFTLTGEVPENMTIQIMTLSGKVVKEITKEELGNIHVGVNRTEYVWEGTDEFGDKLANGVYLYKVKTKNSFGETFTSFEDSRNTNEELFFKEGFGKMVIIR